MTTTTLYINTAADLQALVAQLKFAQERRANGPQDPDCSMGNALHQLLEAPVHSNWSRDDEFEVTQACYRTVTDLVTGVHGPGLMVDALLELEADLNGPRRFLDRDFVLTSLAVGRSALINAGLYVRDENGSDLPIETNFSVLLPQLFIARKPWSDATVVDLAAGRYGLHLQWLTLGSMVKGVMYGGSPTSFTNAICMSGRMDLLSAIADLHVRDLPPGAIASLSKAVNREFKEASTDGGRWLDLLSNTMDRQWHAKGRYLSFPKMISMLGKDDVSRCGRDLAAILVKHDLQHKAIAGLEGSFAYALIMEAAMSCRVSEIASNAQTSAATECSGRRSRVV